MRRFIAYRVLGDGLLLLIVLFAVLALVISPLAAPDKEPARLRPVGTKQVTIGYVDLIHDDGEFDYQLLSEFENRLAQEVWHVRDEGEYLRYYKLIDGFLTTDFYDLEIVNQEICEITHSGNKITGQVIRPINFLREEAEQYQAARLTEAATSGVMYYLIAGEVIPIKVEFIATTVGGYPAVEAHCLNLYTGEPIEYEEIMEIASDE